MNETDWLIDDDPQAMLDHLKRTRRINRTPSGKRKLRLFLCACFRELWEYLPDPRSRAVIELAEELADGPIDSERLNDVEEAAALVYQQSEWVVRGTLFDIRFGQPLISLLPALVHSALDPELWRRVHSTASQLDEIVRRGNAIAALAGPSVRACMIRELFGNPFSPVVPDAAWLEWHDGIVWKMARTIYNEYRFNDLPILADALEDAGCTEGDLLDHCRSGSNHARGCWAVDLLLGKG